MLRVWLPLTKDLRQQGLSNVTIINNGATYSSTGGKLGGCYIFDGVDDAITVGNLSTLVTDNFSFACWFYHDDTWSSKNYETIFGGPSGFELEAKNGSTNSPLMYAYSWGKGTFTYELNQWNHLVMTRTTSETKFYLNGELKLTGSAGSIPSGNYFVGSWSSTTGQNFKGKVNDVRIYDHCLSPMEVKELAKGLVLHYPLNRQGWGQENLVWNTHWDNMPTSWSNWGSPPTREIVSINGKRWLHVKSSDRWQGYSQNQSNRSGVGEITAGEKLTLSCYAYSTTSLTNYPPIGIHWTDGSSIISQSWPQCNLTTTPQKFVTTLTVPSGVSAFNIMVGNGSGTVSGVYEVWISEVKIERGSIATPWCPNSADALAITMGLNSTTEYDCSGFCNNGTRNGTFSWTSDTPKYEVSTYMPKAALITHPRPVFGGVDQEWSCAVWFKLDNISQTSQYLNNFNLGNIILSSTTSLLYLNNDTNDYYMYGKKAITANEWTHIVFVFRNSDALRNVYINGELSNNYGPNKTSIPSGIPDTVIIGTNLAGHISDYRIYATALSADDVKSLYQNSAYIDSSGNVYGAVHSEV